jgi:hypothetical protein
VDFLNKCFDIVGKKALFAHLQIAISPTMTHHFKKTGEIAITPNINNNRYSE